MMSPYQPRDKQALLEAANLQDRAEVLIALTRMALTAHSTGDESRLQ
jgi:Lon protease-like protein